MHWAAAMLYADVCIFHTLGFIHTIVVKKHSVFFFIHWQCCSSQLESNVVLSDFLFLYSKIYSEWLNTPLKSASTAQLLIYTANGTTKMLLTSILTWYNHQIRSYNKFNYRFVNFGFKCSEVKIDWFLLSYTAHK